MAKKLTPPAPPGTLWRFAIDGIPTGEPFTAEEHAAAQDKPVRVITRTLRALEAAGLAARVKAGDL